MAAVLQSNNVGTSSSTHVLAVTATANFVSPTVAGSMLLCCTGSVIENATTAAAPVLSTPTTAGISWQFAIAATTGAQKIGVQTEIAVCAIYYAAGAPSIATTVATSLNSTTTASSVVQLGICIRELSGIKTASALDLTLGPNTGFGVPTLASAITVAHTDYLVFASCGISGWTASGGWNGFNATVGGDYAEYLNATPGGTYPSPFTGTTTAHFACCLAAFLESVAATSAFTAMPLLFGF